MPKTKKSRAKKASCAIPYARGFKLPTAKQRSKAVSACASEDVSSLVKDFQEASHFSPIPHPTSIDDWLAQYNEEGQTYSQFMRENPWLAGRKVKSCQMTFKKSGNTLSERYPDGKIYIMPLGGGWDENSHAPKFANLADYASRFFELPVEILPTVDLEVDRDRQEVYWLDAPEVEGHQQAVTGRRRSKRPRKHRLEARFHTPSGQFQLEGASVLIRVKQVIPPEAICLMALTMCDIYDTPPDLFVAGLAAGNHRVGVFSLKRYSPSLSFSTEHWWHQTDSTLVRATPPNTSRGKGKATSANRKKDAIVMLQRSCKLLVHEISHLLGLDHCIWYSCCMNGSGHLAEDFLQSMHLCPVDLRKLQQLCGFDVVRRYRSLAEFFKVHGLRDEEKWVEQRVRFILSQPG